MHPNKQNKPVAAAVILPGPDTLTSSLSAALSDRVDLWPEQSLRLFSAFVVDDLLVLGQLHSFG